MGLLSKLFAGTIFTFKPDFSKTEYENWLEYLHVGGTDSEWKELKKTQSLEIQNRSDRKIFKI